MRWLDGALRLDLRLAMVDVGWVTHCRLGDKWQLNEQRVAVGWKRHISVGWATHVLWIGHGDRWVDDKWLLGRWAKDKWLIVGLRMPVG